MTLQQTLDAMSLANGVLEAWIGKTPASFGNSGTLYNGRIDWVQATGNVVEYRTADIMVKNLGVVGQEAAYWIGSTPSPVVPATPDAYITGRTTPFTKAQVEAFCNTQWKATSGNANARDIIDFTVQNVTTNTVRVHGYFNDVATNQWQRLTYLITLVDPNGATTGTNVKFFKVIE